MNAVVLAASLLAAAGPAGAGGPGAPGGGGADLEAARVAWRYFERNTDPSTGLVRSVDGYPSTTAWDQGSAIIAAVAARELGLVAAGPFDERIDALLRTLASEPLFEDALPNKAYDTATGQMTDYLNHPAPRGIGYSAVDVGRLASALVLLGELHPAHRAAVERVLSRWDLCRVVHGGELHGAQLEGGAVREAQEGRLGYEQYAARAFALLGRDAALARRWDRFASDVDILGVAVPRDRRDARTYGAVDAVVTEPWVLDAFEFGLDAAAAPLARRIFEVQKRRWETTGVVTALTEDHVDRPPWFVYDAIWADGGAWRTVAPDGKPVDGLRQLSVKAALSLAALYPDDPYAAVLRRAVAPARDPERGWYAGIYEDDGRIDRSLNANTNGVVLEATLFALRGPLQALAASRPGAAAWRASLARTLRPARGCPDATTLAAAPLPGGGAGELPSPGAAALEPPRARPPAHVLGAGTLFFDYRGDDREGTGVLATLYPRGFWFVRGGAEFTPFSPYGSARFLWGFGYDDWHDGTFSATVDNWGPIRTEGELTTGNRAEAELGYKVPRVCVSALCLAAYPSLTVPFQGGPWVGARATLTLAGKWFVMGGLGWSIPHVFPAPAGAPTGHVYWGIGRQDWRPGSIFLTYYDWGPDARQRTGSGMLALGMNWQF